MARSGILIVLTVLCLLGFFGAANAASCLSYPPTIKKGQNCGSVTNCGSGLYCNKAGICTEKVELGQACDDYTSCVSGSQCQGPENAKICVAYGNPGEQCDEDEETTKPRCGYPLTCNEDGICVGGLLGDACGTSLHCSGNLTCASGVCSPIENGQLCVSSGSCKIGSYCDSVTGKCATKKTFGYCSGDDECAYEYYCLGWGSGDSGQCIPKNSREVGEYCEENHHCSGARRCHGSKCAAKRISQCADHSECSEGKYCLCDGDWMVSNSGFGKCSSHSCYSKSVRYEECIVEKCKSSHSQYSKSCSNLNCGDEYKAYSIAC